MKSLKIAKPAEPVNGQDEWAAPAVDSPARLCWQVIKGRTARSAAAPCYYQREPCTSLRQRGFLPFFIFSNVSRRPLARPAKAVSLEKDLLLFCAHFWQNRQGGGV